MYRIFKSNRSTGLSGSQDGAAESGNLTPATYAAVFIISRSSPYPCCSLQSICTSVHTVFCQSVLPVFALSLSLSLSCPYVCLFVYLHCVPKKLWSRTLAITLSNLNRFQKFLHCCKEKEISNRPCVIIPTTP